MNLLDLPDEILLLILKKMHVVDTLFRHNAIHNRLDQLLFDPVYVRELDFTIKLWDDSISPIDNLVIDQICKNILGNINDKIIKLTLEPNSIERVLDAVDYPKVSSLSLINFSNEKLIQYLTENCNLIELLNKKIRHLNINMIDETNNVNNELNLLELIISLSKYLIDFTFHQSIQFEDRNITISQFSSTICFSLRKLNIHLNTFDECLFLFDGRFPSLSHCVFYIHKIFSTSLSIENRILLNLKYFSLTSFTGTHVYDDLIVSFLQRMLNLEELHLLLSVIKCDTFVVVDGNDLKNNILIHLSHLKKFHFSIYTSIHQLNKDIIHKNDFPSNNDLQQSFIDNHQLGKVGSYIHHRSFKDIFQCHVYSLPFQFKTFLRLSSSFSFNIFTHVRSLCINDYVSWDYHFLNKVNKSFPFIETLMICNCLPQENKFQLNNNNYEQFPMITFNRLVDLHISLLHIDYIEQLLFNRYTYLPCLNQLQIKYEQLIIITNNFTINPTQLNCLRIQRLIIKECFVRPQNFSLFFPLL